MGITDNPEKMAKLRICLRAEQIGKAISLIAEITKLPTTSIIPDIQELVATIVKISNHPRFFENGYTETRAEEVAHRLLIIIKESNISLNESTYEKLVQLSAVFQVIKEKREIEARKKHEELRRNALKQEEQEKEERKQQQKYSLKDLELEKKHNQEIFKLDEELCIDYIKSFRRWTSSNQIISNNNIIDHCANIAQIWCERSFNAKLDQQQSLAICSQGQNMTLTARAGSGKTRSLVTRILFQIKHCRIAPNSILALAFNRDAAKEIRERLSEHLSYSEMPHVMTFHALARRIVQPSARILLDEEGHDSKQKLKQTIQRIIGNRFKTTETRDTLQRIMGIRWEESLAHLIKNCLSKDKISEVLGKREVEDRTLDLRRVDDAVHKWIYNFFLWYDIDFKYKKWLHSFGGDTHRATFLLLEDNIIIESSSSVKTNAASNAFNNSEKSNKYTTIYLDTSQDTDRDDIHLQLKSNLRDKKIPLKALSKEELWEKIKSKQIDGFTKSIQQFITRCQKELMWPDDLEKAIHDQDDAEEIQKLFWKEALEIYRDYEAELERTKQTDFDRLLLKAAQKIAQGNTQFSSGKRRPLGDLKRIKHLLIDEFQDFSHLFNELRNSILKVTPDVRFFCVGDDWQAINRFAGSNVSYFHSFAETFPNVRSIGLQTNYRSSTSVVEEGNRIMHGHGPASVAHKTTTGRILQIEPEDLAGLTAEEEILLDATSLLACQIMRIAQAPDMPLAHLLTPSIPAETKHKIVVLSRHSRIEGMTLPEWQNTMRKYLPDEAKEQIEFTTSHGYKGQEANTVILLYPERYPVNHPDSIFATIFGETAIDLELDERRLFYVAVTRAESNLIFLRDSTDKPCDFVPGINQLKKLDISQIQPLLLSGDKALIEVKNLPSVRDIERFGTMPFKDDLKKDFAYKKDKQAWVKSVASEQVQISKSVIALLSKYSWVNKIEQVEVRVSTPILTYQYELNKGQFRRLDASLTAKQQSEIDLLKETIGESLADGVEAILLDLKQDFPEFAYPSDDNSSQLEVAWVEEQVGLYHPDDDIDYFRKRGWRLMAITPQLIKNWEQDLLPCFNSKSSTRVMNEGIHALYHFTDSSNLESIRTHGIFSSKELQAEEIEFTPGGNTLSQELDQKNKLDDYVHLCLTPHHPMAHEAKNRGSIKDPKFLKIKPTILDQPNILACLNVSVASDAEIIPLEKTLSEINWTDWTTYWNNDSITGLEKFANKQIFKIEILVPRHIAHSFITNS